MGYGTRSNYSGGDIQTFWPDDTDKEFYIAYSESLSTILARCQEKWPGVKPEELTISVEHIHTDCIGYDLYDSGDYTCFIRITRSAT